MSPKCATFTSDPDVDPGSGICLVSVSSTRVAGIGPERVRGAEVEKLSSERKLPRVKAPRRFWALDTWFRGGRIAPALCFHWQVVTTTLRTDLSRALTSRRRNH